jgi:GTP cyclohydrolase I
MNLTTLQDAFRDILAHTAENGASIMPDTAADTAERAALAWTTKTEGYTDSVQAHVSAFETQANVRGLIVVREIEIESTCEHHLERIWGYAHVGYIPRAGRVLGLSKFHRVANVFARRLQLQERLTAQIADALDDVLSPQGVGVVIEARHACMEVRGIMRRGQVTTTSELRGVIYDDAATRAEFLALARTSRPF